MDMTNQEYIQYVASKAPKSTYVKNTVLAFVIGGAICTLGQGFLNMFLRFGLEKNDASSATTVLLIFISALLTGLKIYDNIAKYAGAGTLVPVTGFANSIVSPAMEFKSEGFVLGMSAKMFVVAGPVLVFGISASVVYGILLVLFT